MRQTALVDAVVATRYHTIVCALKSAKPTVSIGYAEKCEILMTDMGLSRILPTSRSRSTSASSKINSRNWTARAGELRAMLAEKRGAWRAKVEVQFARLTDSLFPTAQVPKRRGSLQLVQPA